MSSDEYDYGDATYFEGCTCKHEPDEHGWGECNVDNCPCEGGWWE